MHILLLAMIVYIVFAEWRIADLKKKVNSFKNLSAKLEEDGTVWYSGVLPKSDALCLFQETNGDYLLSRLSDKRWLKKDGKVDFERIKRWAYMEDIEKI